jgi:hypothetical protein
MTEAPDEALARLRDEWRRADSQPEKEELTELGKAVAAIVEVFGTGEPESP